jgi:hypothetical protein
MLFVVLAPRQVFVGRYVVAFRPLLWLAPLFARVVALLFALRGVSLVPCCSPPEAGELLKNVVGINVSLVSEDDVSKPWVEMEMEPETPGRFASSDFGPLHRLHAGAGQAVAVVARARVVGSVGFVGRRIGAYKNYFFRERSVRGRETPVGLSAGGEFNCVLGGVRSNAPYA